MKLRNKKTGEIADLSEGCIRDTYNGEMIQIKPVAISNKEGYVYGSLAELNEEWEDYEEPKKHYEILAMGAVMEREDAEDEIFRNQGQREIGNYFETEEEAQKAVEKLKAWKRLKDKGFEFEGYDDGYKHDFNSGHIEFYVKNDGDVLNDLDLLFGGEE